MIGNQPYRPPFLFLRCKFTVFTRDCKLYRMMAVEWTRYQVLHKTLILKNPLGDIHPTILYTVPSIELLVLLTLSILYLASPANQMTIPNAAHLLNTAWIYGT